MCVSTWCLYMHVVCVCPLDDFILSHLSRIGLWHISATTPFYRFVGNSMPFKCMIHHNLYMYYMNHFSGLFYPLLAVITRCTVPHLDSCESETVSSRRPTPSGVATCGASCRYILHEQSSCTESGVTLLMSVIRLASQIGVSGWFPLYGSCTA